MRLRSSRERRFAVLRRSNIPGAGLGLFATEDIPKGTRIGKYIGRVLSDAEVNALPSTRSRDRYLFKVRRGRSIDGYASRSCLVRYVNDARGAIRIPGLSNNSRFLVIKGWPFLVSSRRIREGEEILAPYGGQYWRSVKRMSGPS